MIPRFEFDAVLEKVPDMDACFIRFPYDVFEIFGKKNQVKIKAWIDGEYYRGSLANMGMGCHVLPILKSIRSKIKKNEGDSVHLIIEQDFEERKLVVPDDFLAELSKKPELLSFFESLSYSHRKEYVNWIIEAKRMETRLKRIEKSIEMLANKVKSPNLK
ncbi:MAG: YdeI/OmpD-associated family protein [Bacteroidota bacterium]